MKLRRYKHSVACALCATFFLVGCSEDQRITFNDEIKVGVIHSQTGTMAVSEDSALSGLILAIEDINRGGGITIEGKHPLVLIVRTHDPTPMSMAGPRRVCWEIVKSKWCSGGGLLRDEKR